MRILNFEFCDYCGKASSSLFIRKMKDMHNSYKEFDFCFSCKTELDREDDKYLNSQFKKIALKAAKIQKIKDIWMAGLIANIQNYVKEQEQENQNEKTENKI